MGTPLRFTAKPMLLLRLQATNGREEELLGGSDSKPAERARQLESRLSIARELGLHSSAFPDETGAAHRNRGCAEKRWVQREKRQVFMFCPKQSMGNMGFPPGWICPHQSMASILFLFPFLVVKGIEFTTGQFSFFPRGLKQMEACREYGFSSKLDLSQILSPQLPSK